MWLLSPSGGRGAELQMEEEGDVFGNGMTGLWVPLCVQKMGESKET